MTSSRCGDQAAAYHKTPTSYLLKEVIHTLQQCDTTGWKGILVRHAHNFLKNRADAANAVYSHKLNINHDAYSQIQPIQSIQSVQ
jgi:hypothetical protein